jgi:hypothetical protein
MHSDSEKRGEFRYAPVPPLFVAGDVRRSTKTTTISPRFLIFVAIYNIWGLVHFLRN